MEKETYCKISKAGFGQPYSVLKEVIIKPQKTFHERQELKRAKSLFRRLVVNT